MLPIAVPSPAHLQIIDREFEQQGIVLLALLQYVQTIPQAPPLPEPLRTIATKLGSDDELQIRIDAIDAAVSAGKTSASRLLHEAGYTWDGAHELVKRWPSLSPSRKVSLLQLAALRAAMRSGE